MSLRTGLKAEFRMSEDQALRVMMTAHRRGACVVAVYTKDVAEAKATDAGRRNPDSGIIRMAMVSERSSI
jgi:ATP-dependent Clp protease adapter protein ClpS